MSNRQPAFRMRLVAAIASSLLSAGAIGTLAAPVEADPVWRSFREPGPAARPRAWWHWMNGDVDVPGLRADLQWMKDVGLGGFVIVEGALPGKQRVQPPVLFDSPAWRAAVRATAEEAVRLGLEMGINTSTGWSISGGPWVEPADAMHKLVWQDVEVAGGKPLQLQLPQPPQVSGPYQDIGDTKARRHYEAAAVVAHRIPAGWGVPRPAAVTASEGEPQADRLLDGRHDQPLTLATKGGPAWLVYRYAQPQTVRSAVLGLQTQWGFGAPPAAVVQLEASNDGQHWRPVAELPASQSPVRVAAFAPVRASWFRLRFERSRTKLFPPMGVPMAPGALPIPLPPGDPTFRVTEFRLHHEGLVHRAGEKAGYGTTPDYHAVATPAAAVLQPLRSAQVLDLGSKVDASGVLRWTPPPGRWRITRFGATLTGQVNGPAPADSTGLEVDKLDAGRVKRYIDTYLGTFEKALGKDLMGARGLQVLQADSIESGLQNWSTQLPAEFARRRGYALTPWMPALTGVVIDGAAATDRFLDDFRRTLAELVAEAHYDTLARAAHSRGLRLQAEALEDGRPQLGDDEAMRARADVPMGALWAMPADGTPHISYVADLRGAASVSHVFGRGLVGSETFTSFGAPYADTPRELKATADLAFALGVNQLTFHTSPHQPSQVQAPGAALTVQLGQYFSRHESWAPMARPWVDYLARSSQLLQLGRFHADLAYFYGEEAPVTGLYGERLQDDVPAGYGYDLVGREGLLTRLSVKNGRLVTPEGQSYAVLALGGSSAHMTLAVLRHLATLVEAGATVVGVPPQPAGLGADDREFGRLRERLWGRASGKPCAADGLRAVGRGRVLCERDLAAAMRRLGLAADWQLAPDAGSAASLPVLHRRLDDGEVYFIANPKAQAWSGYVSLNVTGREVELWRADSDERHVPAHQQANGRTQVQLQLAARDAVFVVLRGKTAVSEQRSAPPSWRTLATLAGPWQVGFQAGRGAPAQISLPTLASLTASNDAGVRYFSGIASYSARLDVPADTDPAQALWLDLGEVHELAEVYVNGQPAGGAWKPPYRVKVSGLLKAGDNAIEIRVANRWVNRLIGDMQPGAAPVADVAGPAYGSGAPLQPAGLLGPVRLLATTPGAAVAGPAR